MRDNVYRDKMIMLKKKREQAEKNIGKHTELREKWQKELRKIDLDIMELQSLYNKLSAEELTEAIAMYKKAQAQKNEQHTDKGTNIVGTSEIRNMMYGGNENEDEKD